MKIKMKSKNYEINFVRTFIRRSTEEIYTLEAYENTMLGN